MHYVPWKWRILAPRSSRCFVIATGYISEMEFLFSFFLFSFPSRKGGLIRVIVFFFFFIFFFFIFCWKENTLVEYLQVPPREEKIELKLFSFLSLVWNFIFRVFFWQFCKVFFFYFMENSVATSNLLRQITVLLKCLSRSIKMFTTIYKWVCNVQNLNIRIFKFVYRK